MNIFNNKKVLITGGFGFIGSHVAKRLIDKNSQVHIITIPNTDKYRLKNELDKIICHEADISNTLAINSIIEEINPDYVFHMAGYGVNSADADSTRAINTNILGGVNIINALCKTDCRKIINMGTCAEYGNSAANEGMPPEPVNIYGSTKAAATIILHQIARENGLSIITFRPFGVFGEGEETHKIFSYIISNILNEKDVLLSNCRQHRDYCYVGNIVDAMIMACEREDLVNDIFNVASGESHELKYYVDLLFENMDTDRKPLYGKVDYRKTELWNPKANITKIKTLLNWSAEISLEEGVIQTINWYKNNFSEFHQQEEAKLL